MNEFLQDLILILAPNQPIHLPRGGQYLFLTHTHTRIGGVLHENAIKYRINQNNTKCISLDFLWATYNFFVENNRFPDTQWYMTNGFMGEIQSRPCNKSVAQGLVAIFEANREI